MLPEWLREALASDPHDAACRRPKIFPFSMPHRVKIDLAQEGFGQSREISQCLGVDLSRHHAACLYRRGIECEGILNLDPFGQEIRLKLPLDDDLPLFRCSGRGNTDEDDREHEHEVGHPSLVHDAVLAAIEHRNATRLRKTCFCTRDWRERRDERDAGVRSPKFEVFGTSNPERRTSGRAFPAGKSAVPRLTLVSRFTPHGSTSSPSRAKSRDVSRLLFSILLGLYRRFFGKQHSMFNS